MRTFLQLTLLLSCLLILCSHNINAIDNLDVWTTGHALEENFNETDNHDLDDTLAQATLFIASNSLAEQKFLFEITSNNKLLSNSFIRAPPKYTV